MPYPRSSGATVRDASRTGNAGKPVRAGEDDPLTATSIDDRLAATHRRFLRGGAASALVYLLLYVAIDWLTYVQPVLKLGITPWNPQAGLTLGFLLLWGPRWFPVTGLAALLSEVLVRGAPAPLALLIAASVVIAFGYGGLAAGVRALGLNTFMRSTQAAARFAAATGLATFVIAALYVVLFLAGDRLPLSAAPGSIARYWVGDINGILTVTPLLLYASEWRAAVRAVRERTWEVLAQFAAVAITVWLIFGLATGQELRFFYPLFVPVIWIALRWGVPGSVIAALTIQIGLLIAVLDEGRSPPYVDLQFLMLTLSLTALLLGAAVTERADALRRVALRESEQRALLATAPDAVLTVDWAGLVRSANPAAQKLFGSRATSGEPISALLPSFRIEATEGRATLSGCRSDGATFPAEAAWTQLDAQENPGSLVIVRDATERLRAEAQLRERNTALARAMRFAVAGELASALTHELNQPITALVSYLRASQILAAPFETSDPRLAETLGKAGNEAIRASEVLRRLRDFYRSGSCKRQMIDVHDVCESVVEAFQERMRRQRVQLEIALQSEPLRVEGDRTQLEIVMHNLFSNALDSLTHAAASTRAIRLSARPEEGFVMLDIEDSGPGISPEVSANLFEPFVTTKTDGMGLGLAISRSLLRAQGGELTYESAKRLAGACFTLKIPVRAGGDLQA